LIVKNEFIIGTIFEYLNVECNSYFIGSPSKGSI